MTFAAPAGSLVMRAKGRVASGVHLRGSAKAYETGEVLGALLDEVPIKKHGRYLGTVQALGVAQVRMVGGAKGMSFGEKLYPVFDAKTCTIMASNTPAPGNAACPPFGTLYEASKDNIVLVQLYPHRPGNNPQGSPGSGATPAGRGGGNPEGGATPAQPEGGIEAQVDEAAGAAAAGASGDHTPAEAELTAEEYEDALKDAWSAYHYGTDQLPSKQTLAKWLLGATAGAAAAWAFVQTHTPGDAWNEFGSTLANFSGPGPNEAVSEAMVDVARESGGEVQIGKVRVRPDADPHAYASVAGAYVDDDGTVKGGPGTAAEAVLEHEGRARKVRKTMGFDDFTAEE